MPEDVGYPNESTQERKQRIKKLKARTSKMRLAVVKEKSKKKALEHYNRDVTLDKEEDYISYNKENGKLDTR